jgi:DNA-binding winged helix-turn-helix (wHTH) protein
MNAAVRLSTVCTNTKEFSPFRLDTVNECLWRHRDTGPDERILLPPKAFAVLRYLVEHPGRLVTQDELLEALWPDTFVQPEVLKSHVRDIRMVLGDDCKNPRFIETLPRRGYQFVAPVSGGSTATELGVELPSPKMVGRNATLEIGVGTLFCATMPQASYVSIAVLLSLPGWFAVSSVALTRCFLCPLHGLLSSQRMSAARPHRRFIWSCTARREYGAGTGVCLQRF